MDGSDWRVDWFGTDGGSSPDVRRDSGGDIKPLGREKLLVDPPIPRPNGDGGGGGPGNGNDGLTIVAGALICLSVALFSAA